MNTNPSQDPSEPTVGHKLFVATHELFKPFDLDSYITNHHITGAAEKFLREAAKSPSRSPNGYLSNTLRYPCPVNCHTITAESSRYEFPFILTITNRPDVLRVFEQGPRVVVHGKTKDGHAFTFSCTVDAVVCTASGVEIYEVMASEEVAELCLTSPNRFQETAPHAYASAPAAAFFKDLGFKHLIVTELNMSSGYVKSADFLRSYRMGFALNPITKQEADQVIASVREEPGIFFEDLTLEPHERRAEVVYHLIAKGEIFTHLSDGTLVSKHGLRPQHNLRLYPDAVHEQAFDLLRQTEHRAPADLSELDYVLRVGSLVEIKGGEYMVTKLGKSDVVLRRTKDGREQNLSFSAFLDMKPLIGKILSAEKTFEAKIRDACPEDLLAMLQKHIILRSETINPTGLVPERTLRRWRMAVNKTASTGIAIEALLHPRTGGRRHPQVDDKIDKLLNKLIERYYLTPEGETAMWIFLRLTAINERFKIGKALTYRSVARRCKGIDPYKKALARGGKRYATKFKPIYRKDVLIGSPNGSASWQRAHCDSTAIDLMNVDDGTIQRLFLIKLVDSYDGRVLCHCLTENAPSEDTVRQIMILCVERHRMLPSLIVFDWGPEGKSNWIQMTMEKLWVTLFFRPKATPGQGVNIETLFHKLNVEFLHNLRGSYKLRQRARMLTKAVDPKSRAVWTAAAIREVLAEYYDVINDLPRRNRRAPNEVALESIARYGMPPTQVPEVEAFKLILLPFVDNVTRVVSTRGTVRHREHSYYHDELKAYADKEVQVRHEENDIQHVYVTLPDKGRRTLKCEISDVELKNATPEEAMRIHNETRSAIAESKSEVISKRAKFVMRADRKQKALIAAKDHPVKAAPPPSVPPPEGSAEIIAMPLQLTAIVQP